MISAAVWVCIFVVFVSVASDILTRRMPNLVTLGGLAVGLVIHTAAGFAGASFLGGVKGLGYALLGATACGILPFFAWRKREMGGGDVKLFAAIGALVGPTVGFDIEARTFALSLLILFPYRLVRHGALRIALRNVGIGLANLFKKKDARTPYLTGPKLPPVILGPAIGVALLVTLVQQGILR